MVSVLLCIQTRIYRDGLVGALTGTGQFGHVGACASLGDVPRLLDSERSDVLLIDIRFELGAAAPVATARDAYRAAAGRPIVALGADLSDELVVDLFEAGVDGYVTTSDSIADLERVLCTAARGELCCPPQVARALKERLARLSAISHNENSVGKLSRREMQVLTMVNHGRSNKEIARELRLETSTVKNHVHNIIAKLGVRSRHDAVAALTVQRDGLASR